MTALALLGITCWVVKAALFLYLYAAATFAILGVPSTFFSMSPAVFLCFVLASVGHYAAGFAVGYLSES